MWENKSLSSSNSSSFSDDDLSEIQSREVEEVKQLDNLQISNISNRLLGRRESVSLGTSGDTKTKPDSQASFLFEPLLVSDITESRFTPRPNRGDTFTDCLRRAVTEDDPLVFVTPFNDEDKQWQNSFNYWVKKLLDKYLIRRYKLKVTDKVARLKIS